MATDLQALSRDIQVTCPYDHTDLTEEYIYREIQYSWRNTGEVCSTSVFVEKVTTCTQGHRFAEDIAGKLKVPTSITYQIGDDITDACEKPVLNRARMNEIREEDNQTSTHIAAFSITAITFLANWMLQR
jgi:hypothetical protein